MNYNTSTLKIVNTYQTDISKSCDVNNNINELLCKDSEIVKLRSIGDKKSHNVLDKVCTTDHNNSNTSINIDVNDETNITVNNAQNYRKSNNSDNLLIKDIDDEYLNNTLTVSLCKNVPCGDSRVLGSTWKKLQWYIIIPK